MTLVFLVMLHAMVNPERGSGQRSRTGRGEPRRKPLMVNIQLPLGIGSMRRSLAIVIARIEDIRVWRSAPQESHFYIDHGLRFQVRRKPISIFD